MTTMAEVQANLDDADTHLTRALTHAQALTARDFEDDIDPEYRKTAWCTPVILRNISAGLAAAKQARTKADCAEGLRRAHKWAFKETEGLKATVEGFSDETIVSDDWHDAAKHFADAQEIIEAEYERVETLGW